MPAGFRTAAFVNIVVTVAKVVPILTFIAIAAVGFKAGIFTADFWGKNTQIDGAPHGDTMTQVKNMMLVTVWVFIGIDGRRSTPGAPPGARTSAGAPCSASSVCPTRPWRACWRMVGSWGAAFISIGLIISLLGALIAWVMLCVEILRLPA